MDEIIICVGISGSGKSTWTADFLKQNNNYLRINRDDIRKTLVGDLDGYYQRKDLNIIEDIITTTEEDLIYSFASKGYNIIVDNTNLKQSYINKFLNHQIIDRDYFVKFKLFDVESIAFCKRRVAFRDDLTYNQVNYIDKQFEDYQNIKKWLLENYKDKII